MVPARNVAVEIAVQDPAGARTAFAAGAARVEVCAALDVGGLTPSVGTVRGCAEEAAAAGARGGVHVLIRPRAGGFVYSGEEIRAALRDIGALLDAGADGVVIGALDDRRRVDPEVTRQLVAAAEGHAVTFHRAVDVLDDPAAAVPELVDLGIGRVLTSGGASCVAEGLPVIALMADRAEGRLEIMAGGGAGPDDVPGVRAAGADAIHLSARRRIQDPNPSGPGGASEYWVTDRERAQRVVDAVGG